MTIVRAIHTYRSAAIVRAGSCTAHPIGVSMYARAAWAVITMPIATTRAQSSACVRTPLGGFGDQAAEHVELDVRTRDIVRSGQRDRLPIERELAAALAQAERERLVLLQAARAHVAKQRNLVEAVQEQVALHDLGQPLL